MQAYTKKNNISSIPNSYRSTSTSMDSAELDRLTQLADELDAQKDSQNQAVSGNSWQTHDLTSNQPSNFGHTNYAPAFIDSDDELETARQSQLAEELDAQEEAEKQAAASSSWEKHDLSSTQAYNTEQPTYYNTNIYYDSDEELVEIAEKARRMRIEKESKMQTQPTTYYQASSSQYTPPASQVNYQAVSIRQNTQATQVTKPAYSGQPTSNKNACEIETQVALYKQEAAALDIEDPSSKNKLANIDMGIYSAQKTKLASLDKQLIAAKSARNYAEFSSLVLQRHELAISIVPNIDFVQRLVINVAGNDAIHQFDTFLARAINSYIQSAASYDSDKNDAVQVKFKNTYSTSMGTASTILTALGKSAEVAQAVGGALLPGLAIVTKVMSASILEYKKNQFLTKQKSLNDFMGRFNVNKNEIVDTLVRSCTFIFSQMLSMIRSQLMLESYRDPSIKYDDASIIKNIEKELSKLNKANKVSTAKKIKSKISKSEPDDVQKKYNFLEHFAFVVADSVLDEMVKESQRKNNARNDPKYMVIVAVKKFMHLLNWNAASTASASAATKYLAMNNHKNISPKYHDNLVLYGYGKAPDSWLNKMSSL
jgi:hypothetical protein